MSTDVYQMIGQRIRQARESLRISQQDLAAKLGYASPATVSHFESGERRISIVDLQRIAEILGPPLEYFLQSDSEKCGSDQEDIQHLSFRAYEIRPTARDTVIAFLSFAKKHGKEAPSFLDGLKKLSPGVAATRVLKAAGVTDVPVSPRYIASRLGIPVFEWDFPDEISGIFASDQGRVCIGVNEGHPRVRQRFSISHEMGHMIFDSHEEVFFDFAVAEVGHLSESTKNINREMKANQFAADMLMPARWLRKDFEEYGDDIPSLTKRYEVSQQALWFRLINLKLIQPPA